MLFSGREAPAKVFRTTWPSWSSTQMACRSRPPPPRGQFHKPMGELYIFCLHKVVLMESLNFSCLRVWRPEANIYTYPDLSRFALLIAGNEQLIASAPRCDTARVMAHTFNARRFLDIRADLAAMHLDKAEEAEIQALKRLPRTESDMVIFPGAWRALLTLQDGLRQQLQWREPRTSVSSIHLPQWVGQASSELGPLSPVFHERCISDTPLFCRVRIVSSLEPGLGWI